MKDRITKKCEYCTKEFSFIPKGSYGHLSRRYCTQPCLRKGSHNRSNNYDRNWERINKLNKEEFKWQTTGDQMEIEKQQIKGRLKNQKQKYGLSQICRNEGTV